jgi:hypothetical protein
MRSLLLAVAAMAVVGVAEARAQGWAPPSATENFSGWRYYPYGPAWNPYLMPPPYWAEAAPPAYGGPRLGPCWRVNRWGQVRPRRWC